MREGTGAIEANVQFGHSTDAKLFFCEKKVMKQGVNDCALAKFYHHLYITMATHNIPRLALFQLFFSLLSFPVV